MRYAEQNADEIVWLNITASSESWRTLLEQVEQAAERVDIPVTVGGGVSTVEHVRELLLAGADKVSINSAALRDPGARRARRRRASAASAWSSPSTRDARAAAGASTSTAAARPPSAT